MRNKEKKQIKKSILMIVGMMFMLLGLSELPNHFKYSALVIAIAIFLFLIYGFAKDIIHRMSSTNKGGLN
jgi:uncharacterized membrane protein